MAPRKSVNKSNIVAKLVTGKIEPCAFCHRKVDDELLYGKLYAIGDIQCHYYCVLLSSCLIQKGKDDQGLLGFVYEDILLEIERCKKHKCSFCSQMGANLGCSISQCRKQFHLPCGKERNVISLFYGNYKSFCQNHAPKQKIPESIMVKAKLRKSKDNKARKMKDCYFKDLKELSMNNSDDPESDTQSVCVICYEPVEGYPTPNTFWPPCCARDAWFHRTCLQRMALSAGMHYLKCPLCNDRKNFYEAVVGQGYYVPDRDAAWELEQNAFAEIYERVVSCSATECVCPMGRSHDDDTGSWSIKSCMLCGSSGRHAACGARARHVCRVCGPAAPRCLDELASCIQAVISQEQSQMSSRTRRGPVMPSRMSLRRTKLHTNKHIESCSSQVVPNNETESQSSRNILISREALNLKPPRKASIETISTNNSIKLQFSPKKIENNKHNSPFKELNSPKFDSPTKILVNKDHKSPLKELNSSKFDSPSKILENKDHKSPLKELTSPKFDSPTKILEEGLKKKFGENDVLIKNDLVNQLRERFKRPQPMSVKKKIVDDILNGLFDNLLDEPIQKDPLKPWCSPKKLSETDQDIIEIPQPVPDIIDLTNDQTTKGIQENYPLLYDYLSATPKKLKTIDILTDSSLEISAKDEIVNIDMFKLDDCQKDSVSNFRSPLKTKKCGFKFSSCNNEDLGQNIDIDLESFKNQYLNEVSGPKMVNKENSNKKINRKRKLDEEKIIVKLESKKKKKRRSISIKNKNIQVKIKWRKEQLKLQFNDVKSKKKMKKYKQYVLKYSPENTANSGTLNIAQKCNTDVDKTPVKRKHMKQEKSPDNLVQTSIEKFFKVKSPKEEPGMS